MNKCAKCTNLGGGITEIKIEYKKKELLNMKIKMFNHNSI